MLFCFIKESIGGINFKEDYMYDIKTILNKTEINDLLLDKTRIEFEGQKLRFNSFRLQVFKKELDKNKLECFVCKMKPTHFEIIKGELDTNPHFELVYDNELLSDYVVFSKYYLGGEDKLDNYSVICELCRKKTPINIKPKVIKKQTLFYKFKTYLSNLW